MRQAKNSEIYRPLSRLISNPPPGMLANYKVDVVTEGSAAGLYMYDGEDWVQQAGGGGEVFPPQEHETLADEQDDAGSQSFSTSYVQAGTIQVTLEDGVKYLVLASVQIKAAGVTVAENTVQLQAVLTDNAGIPLGDSLVEIIPLPQTTTSGRPYILPIAEIVTGTGVACQVRIRRQGNTSAGNYEVGIVKLRAVALNHVEGVP